MHDIQYCANGSFLKISIKMSVAGEEGDVCRETLESWRERVKELKRGFEPADIWNQNETGTMWKALPEMSALGSRDGVVVRALVLVEMIISVMTRRG